MNLILTICTIVLILSLLITLYRLYKGPSPADRILCLDAITIHLVAILAGMMIQSKNAYFTDFILALSLLGFFSTIVFANYLEVHYPKDQNEH